MKRNYMYENKTWDNYTEPQHNVGVGGVSTTNPIQRIEYDWRLPKLPQWNRAKPKQPMSFTAFKAAYFLFNTAIIMFICILAAIDGASGDLWSALLGAPLFAALTTWIWKRPAYALYRRVYHW